MKSFCLILSAICLIAQDAQSLTITTSPSNATAMTGDDVILTCETSEEGQQDLIEWTEYVTVDEGRRVWISSSDPSEIDHPQGSEKFEIVDTYNLKIKNIGLEYGGKYSCKLVIQDSSPRTAYVSVFEPAECANMGEDLQEYDMAYISCHVPYGSEVPPEVNFYENGKKMAIDYERGSNYVYISTNITSMAEDDGEVFECRVTLADPAYTDSCTTSLDIKFTARNVSFIPHWDTYYNGDSIECQGKGNPAPSIEWEKVESPGGEENIDDVYLVITPAMVGSNIWACHVTNEVEGNVTRMTEELVFEVLAGSTPADVVGSANSILLSTSTLLFALLSALHHLS